jgi:dTDP-3-amino-3,4,6-trideoxy-alpha-D-glucose transaminase
MKQVPFVDLQAQYQESKLEIDTAIMRVLEKSDYILGGAVEAFEKEFAGYCEVSHAVGVDSGYSALELALRAYGIGPGDEVITTANTFIATVLPIINCGAKPVLVDIDPDNYNLDPDRVSDAVTPATRAIIPVHLYGQPADMDAICSIAKQHDLIVVEDGAQSHGARYKGRRIGSFGHAAAFSFYPTKNLGAFGDGGAVVTDDGAIAEKIRLLRNLGQQVKYRHEIKGFNRRLDTIQAAVLCAKLPKLDACNAARRRLAQNYTEMLSGLPIITPKKVSWAEHVYHLYVVRMKERDALKRHLEGAGIATVLHYPIPLHLQPALKDLGYQRGAFPVTEQYADEIISLPMYPEMHEAAQEIVVSEIRKYVNVMSQPRPVPVSVSSQPA